MARGVKTENGGHKREDQFNIRTPWEVDWLEFLHTLFTGRDNIVSSILTQNENNIDMLLIEFQKQQSPSLQVRAYKELMDQVHSLKSNFWDIKSFNYSKDTLNVITHFSNLGVKLNCYQIITLFLYSIARFSAMNVFREICALLGDFLELVNIKGVKFVQLEDNSFCSEIDAEIIPDIINEFLAKYLPESQTRHQEWLQSQGLPGNLLGVTD